MSRASKTTVVALATGLCTVAIVNGHRLTIATMSAPKTSMSGNNGTMSGGLHISAAWARLINHLVGLHVVHAGETIGQLSMTVKMG